jgi:hypothetical protein
MKLGQTFGMRDSSLKPRTAKAHFIMGVACAPQWQEVIELASDLDEGDIPHNKSASQCLDEFDNFIVKQENFNAYVGRQLKRNAYMIQHLSDYMARVKGELKLISKHASIVTTQVEQVLKAQNDLLNELNDKKNDNAVRIVTRGGRMTQEPLYPVGHPKRIEQDSQRNNVDAPSVGVKTGVSRVGGPELCV